MDKSVRNLIVVLVVLLASCGLCLFTPLMTVGNHVSNGALDYRNQCDSAIGIDPSVTVTATTTPRATVSPSPLPSTNPYVSLTLEPDDPNITDRDRACVSALKSAPYQPPGDVGEPNTGIAVVCAQELAFHYVDNATGDSAVMTRDVIYAASAAALSGRCAVLRTPAGSDTNPSGCGDPNGSARAVVLPETVGQQSHCGRRVHSSAISAGDLVFWDFRNAAATRVGVAVGPEEMVAGDPGGGRFVRQPIPTSRDVLVKRVLGGRR
ncbi:hypothetical protein [Nocardia brevicatena]|uniref:hypothetical protein n=1 Tax=Nocardia brevicatena TaxID=37327 RepID=UPI0003138D3B|nr:hypothetical protein [Nocardia brevicatena]